MRLYCGREIRMDRSFLHAADRIDAETTAESGERRRTMKTLRTLFPLCLALLACCAASPDGWAQGTAPLKVVLIFDINGRGDGGFNDSACSGLEKAAAAFGVKAV